MLHFVSEKQKWINGFWMFGGHLKTLVQLSTIELPKISGATEFETCVFFEDGSSEVLQRYWTQGDAILGHFRLSKSYVCNTFTKIKY